MRRKIHIKKGAILSASLVGAMLFGLSAIASASIETHSRGIFEYLHGERKVVLDATDFDTVKGLIEATDNDTESVAKAIEDGKDLNRPFTSEDLKSVGIAGYAPDGVNNEIIITANDFDALADRFSPYTTFGKEDYAIKSKGTLGYDDPTTDSELEPEILIEGADFSRIDDYMKAQTRHTTFRADGISDRTNDTVPAEIVLDTLASWDTPGQYVFTAPETGSYKLMGYGAQGGNAAGGKGGLGGYTEGVVSLEKGQKLYVTVGGQGKTGTGVENLTDLDGYNGGGSPWPTSKAAGGGGMTTFSTAPSLADSYYTIDAVQKTYDAPLTYNYTGGVQSVTLPKGKYQIEVYGAQGGGTNGGKGGYEKGTYEVTSANETLYLYVGGQGAASSALGAGGGKYGGGHGGVNGYGGGGMTYVSKSGSDNLQAVVNKNTWSESGLIKMDDDSGSPHYSAQFNNLTWTNNRGYDEYISLYAGRYSSDTGYVTVDYNLSTPSSSRNGSKKVYVDSGSYGTSTYDPDALVATILVKNGETLTYYAYAPCTCINNSSRTTMSDPTLFLIVGSGTTSGTNYTTDKSGTFNASSVLLAAGGGGGAGNTTANARGGDGAGYEAAGRPYVNGSLVGVKTKIPATQTNGGGCGQGGGPDGGRFVGCGESATYTTNTGGAGGGYYGGYVTNSTSGGAGGGAGYVNTSVIKDASSGVGVNSGNGRIVITEIPKNTYVAHQTWSNSDKVLMAAAGGGGASISVGQGGKGGDGGGYVSGVGQSGAINTTDAGAGGGGYTGGTVVADKKPGNGGQNYVDGVTLGKSKSGKRKGNGYAGIIYLSSSGEGVIDVSINDESNQETITAHPGTQLTFPEVRKKGYTLIGWYATKGETPTFNEGVQVFEPEAVKAYQPIVNYTYWARWEGNHFNVIFDKNDVEGSNSPVLGSMEAQRFEYDEAKALTTNTYTRRGYTFLGWSTDKNRTPEEFKVSVKRAASDEDPIDDVVDFTDGSTIKNLSDKIEDITIYAVWEPIEYNISYDLNKGSSSTVPVEYKDIETGLAVNPTKYNVESYKDGSELKIMSPSMPGYTFKGWTWTYTNGDEANYQTTEPIIEPVFKNIIGDIRFTANWEANKYTVHFINNLPSASLHRLANIGGVNANSAIANNTADECYQVFTFDADPVALSLDGTTVYPKSEVGYNFIGWSSTSTESGATGNVYVDDEVNTYNNGTFRDSNKLTPISNEITEHMRNLQTVKNLSFGRDTEGKEIIEIYGCWEAKTYNISYNLMDKSEGYGSTEAENPNTETKYTINSVLSLKDATRPGYTFDGWTAEFTSETNDVQTFTKTHPSWTTNPTKESMGAITLSDNVGDVTFTAHWSPNKYTVRYINNIPEASKHRLANIGGVGANNAIANNIAPECYQVFTFDAEPVALSLDGATTYPKAEVGYTFLGWSSTSTEDGAAGNVYSDDNISIYNNGTFRNLNNVTPLSDETEHLINLQRVKNLAFGTDTTGTQTVNIYGCWGAKTYNITYDLQDHTKGLGSTDAENPNTVLAYTIGSEIKLKDATRPGYTFDGWTAEFTGETDDVNTFANTHPSWLTTPTKESMGAITLSDNVGDVVFTAHWSPNTYTIEFNKNQSNGTASEVTGTMDKVVYTFDADPVALPENKYSRNGYNFLGWSTDATLSDTVAEASNKPSPAPGRYSASSKRVAENIVPTDLITANDKTPLKNLSYGTNTKGTTKVTLYAIWDAIEYNLTYDLNDISDTQAPVNPSENDIRTYTVEDYFVPKDPTMLGYTFLGWTGSNGDTPSSFSIQRGTTGDKSYKAEWRANNYTVRYDYNDSTEEGELPDDQSGKFDEVVTFGENNLTKEDAIVHHTKVATIHFDANGGVSDLDSTETSVDYDMGTRYEPNGWTYPLYNGGTNHGTSAKNMTSVDGDTVVLKPYWNLIVDSVEPALMCYTTNTGLSSGTQITASKDPLHTKDTFNSIYNGRYYQYRDKITTYTFVGWYTSRTGGSKVTSFSAPSGSGDNNKTTYYARYTETYSYDYNVYPSNGIVIYEPSGGSYGTWNGNTKGPKNLTGASVTGTASASDAGSYTAKYTPNSGYCWSDGTNNQRSVSWSIDRAKLSYPSYSGTYNGSYQGPGEKDYMTSSGTTEAKNAGSYTAYYTPDDNHCWNNGTYSRYTCSWSISKATIADPTPSKTSWDYDGTTHNLPTAPTGTTRSGTTSIKNAGTATATYSLKDKNNYVWSSSKSTYNNKTTDIPVTFTVNPIAQNITVTPSSKGIYIKDTYKITVSGAKGTLSYKSSSTNVATVSGSGNSATVTGKSKGSSIITITAAATADGNYKASTATARVGVSDAYHKDNESFFQAHYKYDYGTFKDGGVSQGGAKTWQQSSNLLEDHVFGTDAGYVTTEHDNIFNNKNGYRNPLGGWDTISGTLNKCFNYKVSDITGEVVSTNGSTKYVTGYRYFTKPNSSSAYGTNAPSSFMMHVYEVDGTYYYVYASGKTCYLKSTKTKPGNKCNIRDRELTGDSIVFPSSTFSTSNFKISPADHNWYG